MKLFRYEVVQVSDGPAGPGEDIAQRCLTRWGAEAAKKRFESAALLRLAWDLGAAVCGMRFSIVVRKVQDL